MVRAFSLEALLGIYKEFEISHGEKLKDINDPVFLEISKKHRKKKTSTYSALQKNWSKILECSPVLVLNDCCRSNNVSMK